MVEIAGLICSLDFSVTQSLEFVAEMRILLEMNIENRGEKIVSVEKNRQPYFFFQTARRCLQIEGTKLIFIMNFSVLDFCKFASRMPQTAQILVSTFTNFQGGGGDGGAYPGTYREFFFSLAVPGSVTAFY